MSDSGRISTMAMFSRVVLILICLAFTRVNWAQDCQDYSMYNAPYGLLSFPSSHVYYMDVVDEIAYLGGGGDGLQIVDVSDPLQPVPIASSPPQAVYNVRVIGSTAYVRSTDGVLWMINVSDPANPDPIGEYAGVHDIRDIERKDHYLFVTEGDSVAVLDASTPAAPVVLYRFPVPSDSMLEIVDNHLFVFEEELIRYDISDPAVPPSGRSPQIPPPPAFYRYHTVDAVGDYVLTSGIYHLMDQWGTIIFDLTAHDFSVSPPIELGSINAGAESMIIFDDLLLTHSGHLYDISSHGEPDFIRSLPVETRISEMRRSGDAIYMVGTEATTGVMQNLRITNILVEPLPVIGVLDTPGYDIEVVGDLAIIPHKYQGFWTVDVTDRSAPQPIGLFFEDYHSNYVDLWDNLAMLTVWTGEIYFIDISIPDQPELTGLAYAASEHIQDALIMDGFAYLVGESSYPSYAGYFEVFDLRSPGAPERIAYLGLPHGATGVAVRDTLAYVVSAQEPVIRIIDISDKSDPVYLDMMPFDTSGGYQAKIVAHQDLLLASRRDKLCIFDPTLDVLPVQFSELDLPDTIDRLEAFGRFVYVQSSSSFTRTIVDINDPQSPIVIGFVGPLGYGFYADDDYYYMTSPDRLTIAPAQCDDLVPVFLSDFSATVVHGGAVDLQWLISGGYPAVVCRLEARNGDRTWTVPYIHESSGLFMAHDESPHLGAGGTVTYELYLLDDVDTLLHVEQVQIPGFAPSARIIHAAPNPFNPRTEISYRTGHPGRVRLTVYDMAGRQVAVLVDADQPPGGYSVFWRGVDDDDQAMASGKYLLRLESDAGLDVSSVVLLR
ncbi:hypothetical protein H8E07_08080 [bacterium]|nr:hypothetical protein [bacterium]